VVFAPAVSKNFYTALQRAEGLTAGCDSGTAGNRTAGGSAASTTEACLPSLSSPQIRGILSGALESTDYLPGLESPTSGNTSIFICRRSNTSGTQHTFQTYFLGQGCGSPLSFKPAATGAGVTSAWSGTQLGFVSWAGGSSDEVKNCLNGHYQNGDFAIGTLSTESSYDDTANFHRYVKVDGVAPSLENVVAGKYQVFVENQFVKPKGSGTNAKPALSAQVTALADAVQGKLGNPALVKGALVNHTYGWGGILSIPDGDTRVPEITVNHANVQNNPVNSQRVAWGLSEDPNSCALRTISGVASGLKN